ncbi:MAG: response regulator [Armatimonadetes bacterium]|nr:response regulator [Anaerolineae bacterium]
MSAQDANKGIITILLVDDIADTRENIKKLLAFEPDFKVIGAAGTGREAVNQAAELRPDIIIMDINMPDMDGLQATSVITKTVPTSAVIIMSVQDDVDYFRRAMGAGARDFLKKPVDMDELYNTIRRVYRDYEAIRRQYDNSHMVTPAEALRANKATSERSGNIIVVYSPQGGSGKTLIASNLASGLMKEGVKVLLADADLQFGDIQTFLNLQGHLTVVDLINDVADLDAEHFDSVLQTHDSGLKVLLGPARPELADEVRANPGGYAEILKKVSPNYDFIVVDTGVNLDEVTLALFDAATKVILVGTPTLPSVKNVRFVLDLFDKLEYPLDKTMIVLNKVYDEKAGKNATLPVERIQSFLKRPIAAQIPFVDERIILNAIIKAVPVIAADRDTNKAPIRQLLDLADMVYKLLAKQPDPDKAPDKDKDKKRSGLSLRLGR